MMMGFTGSPLDRAEAVRRDPRRLAALREDPAARWLVMEGLRPALGPNGRIGWVRRDAVPADGPEVFLGLLEGAPRFAAAGPAPAGLAPTDARLAAMAAPEDAAILAQARSLLDYHDRHRFCPACGAATRMERGGQLRQCTSCGAEHYPQVAPVVIMLVANGDRVLLGRGPRLPPPVVSALAGFIEPGESMEEAVAREIAEETGVRVLRGSVRYVASQPWPFPASLMLGCLGEAETTEIRIDPHEITWAGWVERAALAAALRGEPGDFTVPPPLTIAHALMRAWLDL